jgi:hypothetical protein
MSLIRSPKESAAGVDVTNWNREIVERLLRFGDRVHRRAAKRWLQRNRSGKRGKA